MVGSLQTLLVENTGMAHTENFTLVDATRWQPRMVVPVRIAGHNGKHLLAESLQEAAA